MEQENQELIKFLFSTLFTIVAIIILVIAFFLFYSKKQEKLQSEIISLKSLTEKELLKTKLEVQEDISNKISREIHDNISLGLTLSKLQINNYIESDPSNTNLLSSTLDLITKSLSDLNDISKSLDSSQLFSHGLVAVLEAEIAVITKSKLLEVEFNIIGETIFLKSEIELIIFRIFQESCNNILKHAKATNITIDLVYDNNHLEMKISDDGKGFNFEETMNSKEVRKMSGLKNIYHRSEIIGAEINIYSTLNIGTTIHLKIPFKNN